MGRAPLRLGAVEIREDGSVLVQTPRDPRSGTTTRVMDPLDFIHAVAAHIPDAYQHLTRFYGAYSNAGRRAGPASTSALAATSADRARSAPSTATAATAATGPAPPGAPEAASPAATAPRRNPPHHPTERRSAWARLIKKVFEVDPLRCQCGGAMRIIAVITPAQPEVIDRIRCHLSRRNRNRGPPGESRAPP